MIVFTLSKPALQLGRPLSTLTIGSEGTLASVLNTFSGEAIDASASLFGCDKVCDFDNSQWLPKVDANS